jgi:hypothetical protein
MVKTLTVKCPHCLQVSQIYLSTNACVIILNCPSCLTPIMYFDRKIFLLTRNQVETIKNSQQESAVMRMLKRIVKTEAPIRDTAGKIVRHCNTELVDRSFTFHQQQVSTAEKYISEDDITNLRIELEVCRDSQQFIDRL